MIVIRKEVFKDINPVNRITDPVIMDAIRKSEGFIPELSLVADCDEDVVGHILMTEVMINGFKELALTSVAVDPKYQKKGIARLLFNGAHDRAREMGYHFVVAGGEPGLFKRFGYVASSMYDIVVPERYLETGFYAKCLNFTEDPIFGDVIYLMDRVKPYMDEETKRKDIGSNVGEGLKTNDIRQNIRKTVQTNDIGQDIRKTVQTNDIRQTVKIHDDVQDKEEEKSMRSNSTPHNAAEPGMIARTVIMPGDPLRAKYIAEKYLENPVLFNTVRNMYGYTGLYKKKRVSVMGSGMGMPSMGIYSYELYNNYDVENIIRVGSAGALKDDVNLRDLVIAQAACTDSNYAYQYELPGCFSPIADYELLEKAVEIARKDGKNIRVGNVASTDIFYNKYTEVNKKWAKMGVLCIEMETAALYMNAAFANKRAISILTISDHLFKEGELSAEERQTGFDDMINIALELAREI